MYSRNKNNKEKNDDSTSGGASSYHESTTTQKTKNGIIVTSSRQITTSTSHVQTKEQTSRTFHAISSSTGSVPRLDFSSSIGNDFGRSIFDNNARPLTDAVAFMPDPNSYASNRYQAPNRSVYHNLSTPNSFPSRSSQHYDLTAISNRLPAWPTISQNRVSAVPPPRATTYSPSSPSPIVNSITKREILPTYKHTSTKLGKVLIINNVNFMDNKDERKGAEKDSKDLKDVFKKLGFEVEHKMNLKGKQISSAVKDFSKSNFVSYNISVVVVMSHGNNLMRDVGKVRGGFTHIIGTDNEPVSAEDLIDLFTLGNYHPSLKQKPKIFIFQCCRGDKDLEVQHDAAPIKKQYKDYADILVAFSTLPGYVSNRNPKTGTWYIQSLCNVFEKHHQDFHVEEMLKIVDNELSQKHPNYSQTSTYESRGFKICFLHKKVNNNA